MLIKTSKQLANISAFCAIMIVSQLLLSGVKGVEIITALFYCYCYIYGSKQGVIVALCFTLLRCLLFGFFPSVVVLYLIYYVIFALIAGLVGLKINKKRQVTQIIVSVITCVILTCLFTLIDDFIVYPIFYGVNGKGLTAYFYMSLGVMVTQMVCSAVTVAIMFLPLTKVFNRFSH